MKNIWLIIAIVCLVSTTLNAQISEIDSALSVRGRVTNVAGQSLSGAIVIIASNSKGTSTDENGYYILSDVPRGSTLVFNNIGYKLLMQDVPNEQRLLNQQILDVVLEVNREELPPMGATAVYKAIKLNKNMPAVATLPESATQAGTVVEEKAYFPTGNIGLMQYVANSLRYPAQAKAAKIEGDVLVEFTVTSTGAVDLVKVDKELNRECDQEAVRVVKQMPKWIPGKQSGKPVPTVYVLPIRFTLE